MGNKTTGFCVRVGPSVNDWSLEAINPLVSMLGGRVCDCLVSGGNKTTRYGVMVRNEVIVWSLGAMRPLVSVSG